MFIRHWNSLAGEEGPGDAGGPSVLWMPSKAVAPPAGAASAGEAVTLQQCWWQARQSIRHEIEVDGHDAGYTWGVISGCEVVPVQAARVLGMTV